jgi:hypothetical protein
MMQLLFVETRERNSLMKLEEILFLFLLCGLVLCSAFAAGNKLVPWPPRLQPCKAELP